MRSLKITLILMIALSLRSAGQAQIKWQRTYGGHPFNYGCRVIQLPDTGYIFLADESSLVGNTAIHLIRTDKNGLIKWEKQISDTMLRWANDFKQLGDGGYIIAGYSYPSVVRGYDLMLLKTDSAGSVEWEREAGGNDWDMGNAVAITPDSDYVVVGETFSYGHANGNVYIVKFNSLGDTLWTRTYGGDSLDFAVAVDITADSNYLIGANTRSYGKGGMDGWVFKLSPKGDTTWSCFYGDTLDDQINSLITLKDKGFIFVGETRNYGAISLDDWLMRLDSANNLHMSFPQAWTIGPGDDVFESVSINDSAQYIISGYTTGAGHGGREVTLLIENDWYISKFSKTYGSFRDDEATQAIQTSDKGYIIMGNTNGMGPSNDNVYVIKTDPYCESLLTSDYTTGINDNITINRQGLVVYPNPSDGLIRVSIPDNLSRNDGTLKIFDFSGACVWELQINDANSNKPFDIDLQNLSAGIYFVVLSTNSERLTAKFIKE